MGVMLDHKIQSYRQEITLLDGRRAVIRPIHTGDKASLMAFHSRLSDDTRFLRYHYFKGQLTESDLKDFCEMDYYNNLALAAEIEQEGKKEIIGEGRFCRLPNVCTAEVAFVVQDSEQRKGIGTQLLTHLAILALERDIYYFTGEVLRQNGRMLSIFRKADAGLRQEIDSPSTCTINLSVRESY
jgi:GNAT superfamily N-acetyltransferase